MSFLVDWIWDWLYKLGFWKKKATILLLGLDNAGKTTLLYKLKYGSIRLVIPTQRAQLEELTVGNVTFRAWDIGGHIQVRSLWKDYFFEADAVIFLVDTADRERITESKQELQALLNDTNLSKSIFLILGNKTDLDDALSYKELIEGLELQSILTERENVKLFQCSLVEGTGYDQGFKWLSDIL
eukprot:TRINITY_DN7255_c0_g1_i1.p1 TRINITY_DN7255_c0_g1~~TRINITY_DN7255_c0_g1_i1.p1  ORF type:complete len:184 (+),score=39.28 TRINITY_DN7255_c0_g1_i1:50-601(+)